MSGRFISKKQDGKVRFLNLFCILFVLIPGSLSAQVSKAKEDGKRLFEVSVSVTGLFSFGNRERIFALSNASILLNGKLFTAEYEPALVYNRVNKRLTEEDHYHRLLLTLRPASLIQPLIFALYESSERRQLEHRLIGGPGLGISILNKPTYSIRLMNAVVYDINRYRSSSFNLLGTHPDPTLYRWRYTTRLITRKEITEHLTVGIDGWHQQTIDELRDYRFRVDVNLDMKLITSLSFRTALNLFYESIVVSGREEMDALMSFGFTWIRN